MSSSNRASDKLPERHFCVESVTTPDVRELRVFCSVPGPRLLRKIRQTKRIQSIFEEAV